MILKYEDLWYPLRAIGSSLISPWNDKRHIAVCMGMRGGKTTLIQCMVSYFEYCIVYSDTYKTLDLQTYSETPIKNLEIRPFKQVLTKAEAMHLQGLKVLIAYDNVFFCEDSLKALENWLDLRKFFFFKSFICGSNGPFLDDWLKHMRILSFPTWEVCPFIAPPKRSDLHSIEYINRFGGLNLTQKLNNEIWNR